MFPLIVPQWGNLKVTAAPWTQSSKTMFPKMHKRKQIPYLQTASVYCPTNWWDIRDRLVPSSACDPAVLRLDLFLTQRCSKDIAESNTVKLSLTDQARAQM